MKIAIITQPLRTNYGGILQNYALHTILKRMGHKPTTLQRDEFRKPVFYRYFLIIIKRLLLRVIGKYKNPIFYESKYKEDYKVFTQHTLSFVKRYIDTITVDYSNPSLSESDYGAYVVGSDQVWRPSYNNIYFTFLYFAKGWNVKRCAYAASFGTDEWEYSSEETERCKYFACFFDAISVREESGILLCKKYLHVNAEHVLDPTFLLEIKDYEYLIDNASTTPSEGQIFIHFLDKSSDKIKLVDKIAKANKWKSFEVNSKVDEHELNSPIEQRIQPPVEQWLRAFKEAKYVVTDSFHATAFSIIFNKPFIVYVNKGRGAARFYSLLKLFGLENRLVYNSNEFDNYSINKIDYEQINAKVVEIRKKSLNFLEKGLN